MPSYSSSSRLASRLAYVSFYQKPAHTGPLALVNAVSESLFDRPGANIEELVHCATDTDQTIDAYASLPPPEHKQLASICRQLCLRGYGICFGAAGNERFRFQDSPHSGACRPQLVCNQDFFVVRRLPDGAFAAMSASKAASAGSAAIHVVPEAVALDDPASHILLNCADAAIAPSLALAYTSVALQDNDLYQEMRHIGGASDWDTSKAAFCPDTWHRIFSKTDTAHNLAILRAACRA